MKVRIRLQPDDREVEVQAEQRLLDAALDAGLPIPFGCQSARCGVCRVRVLNGTEAGLAPPSVIEAAALEAFAAPEGVRLACQAYLVRDVEVGRIPETGTKHWR